MLRRVVSSVHGRLAECEQSNGGHLEDVTSGMVCYVYFLLCVMFQDQCSLISAHAKVSISL